MKIQNLKEVFKKFSADQNRSILVDGAWGIGKTYHVLQFLKEVKEEKSKQKTAYVSLFGKSSIDEVHTEIYSRLHPIRQNSKKILQVIPKVAPLLGAVGDIVSNLEFALKDTDTEGNSTDAAISDNLSAVVEIADKLPIPADTSEKLNSKASNDHKNIIILDDFERLNFDKISFVDILGYVNSLFLQKFKVIVICNSKEIPQKQADNFLSFKEKVFDREYIITATDEDVINSYFKKEVLPLGEHIINEFGNNLRIAKRVSSFYVEACDTLKEIDPNYFKKITQDNILFSCTLVVVACNTSAYAQKETQNPDLTETMMLASLNLDESLHNTILCINSHVKDNRLGQINNQFISGLLLLYYYNDITGLSMFLGEHEQKASNLLLEEAFFLSDSAKEELFDRQFNYILEQRELKSGNVFQAVKSMCKYHTYSHIDEREKELIFNLLQKCDEKDIYMFSEIILDGEKEPPRLTQFRNAFVKTRLNLLISNMCSELDNLYKEKRYPVITDRLNTISRGNIYYNVNDGKYFLNENILVAIKECNFFIDDLFGNVSPSQWNVALQICDLSKQYNFSDELILFINDLDFKNDKSAEDRYTFLIQNKLKQYN